MKHLTEIESQQYMSSREIAKITGKQHSNVMRDIRDMLSGLNIEQNSLLNFDNSGAKGRKVEFFKLDRELSFTLVSGYNVVLRNKIIKRWGELEDNNARGSISGDDNQLLALAHGVIRLQGELEEAKRTKAHINDKRTATLMGKAGADAKRIKKLEAQLQDQGDYQSVIGANLPQRIDTATKKNIQTWRILKDISIARGIEVKSVVCPRFGKANVYHVSVIDEFKSNYL